MSTQTLPPAAEVLPDMVVSLQIGAGNLDRFLDLIGDAAGPRIKYLEGSLILVSPSRDHDQAAERLDDLIKAIGGILRIGFRGFGSTLYRKPGVDRAIEPDKSYYVRNYKAVAGKELDLSIDPPPDLVVEIVASHGAEKAMAVCQGLRVPEVWVYHVQAARLEIFHLKITGKHAGDYVASGKSLAFPFLKPDEVAAWLSDGEEDDGLFDRRVRKWVRSVLAPRFRAGHS